MVVRDKLHFVLKAFCSNDIMSQWHFARQAFCHKDIYKLLSPLLGSTLFKDILFAMAFCLKYILFQRYFVPRQYLPRHYVPKAFCLKEILSQWHFVHKALCHKGYQSNDRQHFCLMAFCSKAIYPKGISPQDILSLRHFVPKTFCPRGNMSPRHFVPETLMILMFWSQHGLPHSAESHQTMRSEQRKYLS